jgi:RNA polymerase sigma-70 factor (ECF subfamily)
VTEIPAGTHSEGGGAATAQALPQPVDFRRLYEAEVGFVWNRLRRLGVAERDLEDKVHDVFLVAHRKLGSHDGVGPIRAWLAAITVRVALDHRRLACNRREVLHDGVEAVDQEPGPESALQRKQARDLVLLALDALPEDQRAVFVLKEIEGFSMPEIASMLDAPLNTLYSRLRLGRERFCAAVKRLRDGEP